MRRMQIGSKSMRQFESLWLADVNKESLSLEGCRLELVPFKTESERLVNMTTNIAGEEERGVKWTSGTVGERPSITKRHL